MNIIFVFKTNMKYFIVYYCSCLFAPAKFEDLGDRRQVLYVYFLPMKTHPQEKENYLYCIYIRQFQSHL